MVKVDHVLLSLVKDFLHLYENLSAGYPYISFSICVIEFDKSSPLSHLAHDADAIKSTRENNELLDNLST